MKTDVIEALGEDALGQPPRLNAALAANGGLLTNQSPD